MDATASRDGLKDAIRRVELPLERLEQLLEEDEDSTAEIVPVSPAEAAEVLERLSATGTRR